MKKIIACLIFLPVLIGPLILNAGNGRQKEAVTEDSTQYINRVTDEHATSVEFLKTTAYLADVSTVSLYSEIDYVTPRNWQKKPFTLNLMANTPLKVGGKWAHIPNRGIYFAMHINPDCQLRVFQDDPATHDESEPIRTPSFKPGVTFFVTANKLWNTGTRRPKHYFFLKIYHHSNGQAGTHFTTDGYWNRYDGDFSDNVVCELGYGGIAGGIVKKTVGEEIMRAGWGRTAAAYNYYWKGSFSIHPPSDLEPDMVRYHLYGYYRSSAQVGFIWAPYYQEYIYNRKRGIKHAVGVPVRKEIFRVYATFDYIWDGGLNTGPRLSLSRVKMYDLSKRLNVVVTFSARIPGTSFLGLFAQGGYYATDPYNVYFQQSMAFCRIGLSVGHFITETNGGAKKKSAAANGTGL